MTLEGQWHDEALGDEPQVLGPNEYLIKLEKDGEDDQFIVPEDVSYQPEMNTVMPFRATVRPDDYLSDETYIGSTMTVEVNGEQLFQGELKTIQTNQQDAPFEIEAHSPGLKLKDDDIDREIDQDVAYDFIARTIDQYNEYDAEMRDLIGTDDEDVDENIIEHEIVRESFADGASVVFKSVGEAAISVEVIYVKVRTPDDTEVEITVSTGVESYSESISGQDQSQYGDWVKVEPSGLDNDEYDITFTMDEGTLLYDWISLTEQTISRDVTAPEVDVFEEDVEVQGSVEDGFEGVDEDDPHSPFYVSGGKLRAAQTAWMLRAIDADDDNIGGIGVELGAGNILGDPDPGENWFTPGLGRIEDLGHYMEWSFSPDYVIPEDSLRMRVRNVIRDDDNDPPTTEEDALTMTIFIDSEEVGSFLIWGDGVAPMWALGTIDNPELDTSSHTIRIEVTNIIDEDWHGRIDFAYLFDRRFDMDDDIFPFDNHVDRVNDDGEEDDGGDWAMFDDAIRLYPESVDYIGNEHLHTDNITKARINTNFKYTDRTELQLTFDEDTTRLPREGTEEVETIEADPPYITLSVQPIVSMGATPVPTDPPRDPQGSGNFLRWGWDGNEIDQWELLVDTDDMDILYDTQVRENRLSAISSTADETKVTFRFDGDEAKIFKRGQLVTDPDLRKETIEESITTDGSYRSVEVLGKNVTSGIIEWDDAPDIVTAHKQIEDYRKQSERACLTRAFAFLRENGVVHYTGEIETLPTLAPVGETMKGHHFNHGKDMKIHSVDYSKDRARIELGKKTGLGEEIIELRRGTFRFSLSRDPSVNADRIEAVDEMYIPVEDD